MPNFRLMWLVVDAITFKVVVRCWLKGAAVFYANNHTAPCYVVAEHIDKPGKFTFME